MPLTIVTTTTVRAVAVITEAQIREAFDLPADADIWISSSECTDGLELTAEWTPPLTLADKVERRRHLIKGEAP